MYPKLKGRDKTLFIVPTLKIEKVTRSSSSTVYVTAMPEISTEIRRLVIPASYTVKELYSSCLVDLTRQTAFIGTHWFIVWASLGTLTPKL